MVAEEVDPLAARRSVVTAYNRALDEHRRRVAEHPRAVERWRAEHEAWRQQEAALVAGVAARRAELEQALTRWQVRRAVPVEPVDLAPVDLAPVEVVEPAPVDAVEPAPVAVVRRPLVLAPAPGEAGSSPPEAREPGEDPRPAAPTRPVEAVTAWVPRQPAALGWPAPPARAPGVTADPLRAGGTGWPDALVTAGRAGPGT